MLISSPIIGAHVSVAGGLHLAPERAHSIGANGIQIFTRNQRTWRAKPISNDELKAFQAAIKDYPLQSITSHASYLLNLANPHAEPWERSIVALAQEYERCQILNIPLLVIHPGAHLDSGLEAGIKRIAAALDRVLGNVDEGPTLLLENVAGQGTTIGRTFDELASIIGAMDHGHRTGFCLDTAHAYAAGYDLSSESGFASTMEELARTLGGERLHMLHINDSKVPLNSRKDRHAPLGHGHMGWSAFARLLQDPLTAQLPMILETPSGMEGWATEIAQLRQLTSNNTR
ncbi:deoxyribonuclease IV [Desulfurispira natronophila]|uniref:Probable endonuclease 4 n=1 Tax=Desulfurispira natronophila TaxID=682562 RepID=A0A7W7Y3K6_9BACT|nr:deoxyribonuclease-4 [Desulfurispira natronophila]